MEEVISAIMQANEDEIEKILLTTIHRKRELYPNWDILYQVKLKEVPADAGEQTSRGSQLAVLQNK